MWHTLLWASLCLHLLRLVKRKFHPWQCPESLAWRVRWEGAGTNLRPPSCVVCRPVLVGGIQFKDFFSKIKVSHNFESHWLSLKTIQKSHFSAVPLPWLFLCSRGPHCHPVPAVRSQPKSSPKISYLAAHFRTFVLIGNQRFRGFLRCEKARENLNYTLLHDFSIDFK